MALDSSQFYKDPKTGITYTSFDSYNQNVNGVALPGSVNPNTAQNVNPPSTGAPVGTGEQPPNPNPVPTPGSTSQFSSYVKSDTSPTVYGKDAQGNYTAFSNEQDFLKSGGNFANVQTVKGFNPGTTSIYNQTQPSTTNPSAPAGIGDIPTTPDGSPDYYKLYQKQLQQFGIGTGDPNSDPNQQLLDVNKQIAADQQVLAPLTPEMVQAQFPDALKPLQEGGATQAQLNLKAAQAAAPIQSAMGFLISSRSALGTYITNAQSFATNAVQQAKDTFTQQLAFQQFDFTQIGSHVNELGQTVPDYGYVQKLTGKIIPAAGPNPGDITSNDYGTGSGFPQSIGTRPSPSNPKITEYYNTQTGQGFSSAQQLADYYNKATNTNTATASNVFGLLQKNNPVIGSNVQNARTDRNFNPIASSIAVNADGTPNTNDPTTAEWLNALNKTNIPYSIEQDANFGNRATIKFATSQAGLDGAITLLGTSAFSWYKNHTGQAELAGVSSPSEFKALPYDKKVAIVKGIYSNEQPGGQMFNTTSVAGGATNQSVQKQISSLPPLLQNYVHTSPTGYAYTSSSTPDGIRLGISSKAHDVIPLDKDTAAQEDNLVKGYGFVKQGQNLVDSLKLPTNPYDTKRLGNTWNQALNNDPKLAQLKQLWQGAITILSGLGSSGIRSTTLIDQSANTDFPTGSSIDSVARAQLDGLYKIIQNEETTIMGRPAPLDYSGYGTSVTQPTQSESVYNSLNLNSALAGGGLSTP